MDLEDLWIPQSGRFTDSPIWKIYGFPNLEDLRIPQSRIFMDFQIQNVKTPMWIPNSVKLPNRIVWNTIYKLRK